MWESCGLPDKGIASLRSALSKRFSMSNTLTEEEMRNALFGSSPPAKVTSKLKSELQFVPTKPSAQVAPSRPASKSLFPKVRVTLHVSKIFEGEIEMIVHEARTLSKLVAEQEAKDAAKKRKFKYIEVVSVEQV